MLVWHQLLVEETSSRGSRSLKKWGSQYNVTLNELGAGIQLEAMFVNSAAPLQGDTKRVASLAIPCFPLLRLTPATTPAALESPKCNSKRWLGMELVGSSLLEVCNFVQEGGTVGARDSPFL